MTFSWFFGKIIVYLYHNQSKRYCLLGTFKIKNFMETYKILFIESAEVAAYYEVIEVKTPACFQKIKRVITNEEAASAFERLKTAANMEELFHRYSWVMLAVK